MPQSLSTLDPFLKENYQDGIIDQIHRASPITELFEDASADESADGRAVVVATKLRDSEGIGHIGERGTIPSAGNAVGGNFRIGLKYGYIPIELSEQSMAFSKSNETSFIRALKLEMDSSTSTYKKELSRKVCGAGSGIVCRVNGAVAPAGTIVVVDDPAGVTGAVGGQNGARFLRVGMRVAFLDPITSAILAVRTVTAVAALGNSITVDAPLAAGLVDNAVVTTVSTASATATSLDLGFGNEPMGIMGLFDDGTYNASLFGISRATFPILNAYTDGTAAGLSLDRIQRAIDVTYQRGGEQVDCLAAGPEVQRGYLALLEAFRRYTSEKLISPDGGTNAAKKFSGGLTYGNLPLVIDYNLPYGQLFGFVKGNCKRYSIGKGKWDDRTGSIFRQMSGANGLIHSYFAFWFEFANYAYLNPNTSFRISEITGLNTIYVPS